ncbi:Uu.00g049420.m01.CDS01 [Anthostomella pinea]|uniref:Altered inheritance of mitochondria protein 6 n=1 Tax=Anthostomella pinea TaxID=933095 RepID=A0AAI8VBT6_9PEZI|nr:Uu.00g049420.m01.CDS01 [Anthostomella pinea]
MFYNSRDKEDWEYPVADVTQWLVRHTDSVLPIPCHSHNDYWRRSPLFSALAAGCTGIEADVWLTANGQDLLVGHDRRSLRPGKTLRSMYLDPLLAMLDHRNPAATWGNRSAGERARGVYHTAPDTTVVLMIDVKEKPEVIWPMVMRQLEPLRRKGYLTRYQAASAGTNEMQTQTLWPGPLIVVGSGDLTLQGLRGCYPRGRGGFDASHDTFLDAPILSIAAQQRTESELESVSYYSPANSHYASASFKRAVGHVLFGISDEQLETLRAQIRAARARGLVVRYWDIPGWPVNYRDYIWSVLTREGVDMLCVDDLAAARGAWTERYVQSAVPATALSVVGVVLFVAVSVMGGYLQK